MIYLFTTVGVCVFLSNFDLQVGCYWIVQCHLKVDQYDLDDFAVDRHVDGWDHFVVVVQSESQQWTHTHRRTEIFAIISMCYVHSRARDNTPMCVSLSSLCCSCVCVCVCLWNIVKIRRVATEQWNRGELLLRWLRRVQVDLTRCR